MSQSSNDELKTHQVDTNAALIKITHAESDYLSSDSEEDEAKREHENDIINSETNEARLKGGIGEASDSIEKINDGKNNNLPRTIETDNSPPLQPVVVKSNLISISKSPNYVWDRETIKRRFNPFDRDIHIEDNHFDLSPDNLVGVHSTDSLVDINKLAGTVSSAGSSVESWDGLSPDHQEDNENDVSFADLGVSEDHFSQPEGHFGLSTIEELEMAIENCKDLIIESSDNMERKKNLVAKLVQLRLKLQEAKEKPQEPDPDIKPVLGHHFRERNGQSNKQPCEKCKNVIWGVLNPWFECDRCSFSCHTKCMNNIRRMCPMSKVIENPSYITSICPEKGLADQNYRCSECRIQISFKNGSAEPRQCDYSGSFYCDNCHWNDTMVIPARILHNWDFTPRKVSRSTRQYLRLMVSRAVIRIQDINPMLFSFVEELNEIKRLREEILIMKKYFLSCQDALASKLLLQLHDRQHFVENSDMYALQDLLDLQSDVLLPTVTKIHASFAQHIKSECSRCQAKGFICELCDDKEILFPFDNIAIVCSRCSAVLHRHCHVKRGNICPRCERRKKKNSTVSSPENT